MFGVYWFVVPSLLFALIPVFLEIALTNIFDDIVEKGKLDGSATLVHCRVGVSRSATICIAEVMASMGLSFPRA